MELIKRRNHAALFYFGIQLAFLTKKDMALSDELLQKINKKFEPSSTVSLLYRNYDLVLKTDKEGNAIQLFIGKASEEGIIKGDRYARTLKYDRNGKLIKDHWERKGKAS